MSPEKIKKLQATFLRPGTPAEKETARTILAKYNALPKEKDEIGQSIHLINRNRAADLYKILKETGHPLLKSKSKEEIEYFFHNHYDTLKDKEPYDLGAKRFSELIISLRNS